MSSPFDILLQRVRVDLPSGDLLFRVRELSVPHGAHVLIHGESGSGKTTLLHLIAGLFVPQDGFVQIGDRRLDRLREDEVCDFRRAHLGVIFQKLNLVDHLTVEENVALPLDEGDASARARAALAGVNLAGREKDRCSYLSLGEQQRVAVARVIASAPDIILADEPTSSLDEKNSRYVMESLKNAAHGKTLITVSHDPRIASYFDHTRPFAEITA